MKQTGIRYISILLVVVLLLTTCSCGLFANFNDGMTEEDYEYHPEAAQKSEDGGNRWIWGVVAVVLIIFGIIGVAAPESSWKMSYGWKFKDAEPSNAALAFEKAGGILALFVGGIMLLYAIAS